MAALTEMQKQELARTLADRWAQYGAEMQADQNLFWQIIEGKVMPPPIHAPTLDGLTVCVDCGEQLQHTLRHNVSLCRRFVVVTASHDHLTQRIAHEAGAEIVVTDACYDHQAAFNKGAMLEYGLQHLQAGLDWLVLTDADCFLPPGLSEEIPSLSPTSLWYTRRYHLLPGVVTPDRNKISDLHRQDLAGNNGPFGYLQLFRPAAVEGSLRFPDCFASAGSIDWWLATRWPANRRKRLPIAMLVLHLWHGKLAHRWNNGRGDGCWRWAGQSDLGPMAKWLPTWPIPCRVRQTVIETCSQQEGEWSGGELPRFSPPLASQRCEWTVRG